MTPKPSSTNRRSMRIAMKQATTTHPSSTRGVSRTSSTPSPTSRPPTHTTSKQPTPNKPTGITKRRQPSKPLRKTHPKLLGPVSPSSLSSGRHTSPLLRLPPELRLMIWEEVLTSPDGVLRFDSRTRRFDVSRIGAGLLTTCHSVALETQDLPLKLNLLRFGPGGADEIPTRPKGVNDFLYFSKRVMSVERKCGWMLRIKGASLGS